MKRSWRDGRHISSLDNLNNTDIGQLLSYMIGHYVKSISSGIEEFVPMLGMYVEGSKVELNACQERLYINFVF